MRAPTRLFRMLRAGLALACLQTLPGQTGATREAEFHSAVRPFLARHCLSCHGEKLKTANLDLSAAKASEAVWPKVLDKLAAGKMPPPGFPAPPRAEVDGVLRWLESGAGSPGAAPDPGRVTARRLNRTEYNNTVRDLTGVAFRPADDFPVDDSGYGFDTIGDVLSLSPMLMEKYMAAARRISRVAVYGETVPPKPTVLARLMAKRSYDGGGLAGSHYLPYSMRGALYGSFVFPVDAVYELRFRVMNLRPDAALGGPRGRRPTPEEVKAQLERARAAAPPVKLALTVDGKTVLEDVIEGTTSFGYDRGEFVARVPLRAGEHLLRASFPEFAGRDPLANVNPDRRRQLFVDYLDIAGPFEPSAEPSAGYRKIFVCGHNPGGHQPACSRTILETLARRAYRRPPAPEDVERLAALAETARRDGGSFEEGIRLALQAVLVSPRFLFRIERNDPGGGARALDGFELASRLSYFLWATMPDDELLRAAAEGVLAEPDGVRARARRMLGNPKSSALTESFAAQWLQLRDLGKKKPDPERFPAMDDELLDAMRRETNLFFEAMLREDRSVLDFLDAPFTFLNGPLARHYGIAGVSGEEFRRVEVDARQRGGLLSHAAILTVASYPTRTSPVIRGKWVLENLLGALPPPPPADVPELEEAKIGLSGSLRMQLEEHRKNPACSVCHDQMDAIGFGLENYDAAGAWRTHDGKFPIDSSGTLPDGRSFQGPGELKQVLRSQSRLFVRNLTEKLLTYALGRGLEPFDRPAVEVIVSAVEGDGGRFSKLILEIVNSPPFRMRGGEQR